MADDHSQRLFRSTNAPAQGGQGRGQTPPVSADPLAELARLIGQNDPFGEYGRAHAQPTPAVQPVRPMQAAPATAPLQWDIDQSTAAYTQHDPLGEAQMPPGYSAQHAGAYDQAGQGAGHEAGYYAAPHGHDEYDPNDPHYAHDDQDYYDDVPPSRRRMGVMIIAGIFALAVIGTAGAFGYRAVFGSSGAHGVPPVIKADITPSKIMPTGASKDNSSKLITDRLNDRSQDEHVVSREEKPVDVNAGQAAPGLTTGQVASRPDATRAPLGSGVIATEPKRVRTIAIHPDGTMEAAATPPMAAAEPEAAPPAAPPLAAMPEPAPQQVAPPAVNPPMQLADPQPAPAYEPPRQAAARPAPKPAPVAPYRAASVASHAPLSLSPDAPAPRPVAPTRTASVAPTQLAPAASSVARSGGYAVQVSSQRSEAEAQAAFRGLQGKYPSQLGRHQLLVHRVDLGAKGVYYRAMVGPFASAGEASQLCSSLKAAGGQCIVQKN